VRAGDPRISLRRGRGHGDGKRCGKFVLEEITRGF
jgi:hypothetical protein